MSAPASIPLFGDAYLADTRHLSLEEHGAYCQLLMIAWRLPNCALPDDEKRISQMLGVTPKKWATIRDSVMAFWSLTEFGWQQKRLLKEYKWASEKSAKAAASARSRHGSNPSKPFPPGSNSSGDDLNSREADRGDNSLKTHKTRDANAGANAHANGHANGHAPPPPQEREDNNKPSSTEPREPADAPKPPNHHPDDPGPTPEDRREPTKPAAKPHPTAALAVEIMKLAHMAAPPSDMHLVGEWLAAGADPDKHILPTVEKLASRGKPISLFKYFDRAVRDAVALDQAEVEAKLREFTYRSPRAAPLDPDEEAARQKYLAAAEARKRAQSGADADVQKFMGTGR